jgi:hypothetical protein
MVHEIADGFEFKSGNTTYNKENSRYITFEYRADDSTDEKVVNKILKLINDSYQLCENCVHAKREGAFCGFCAPYCDIDHKSIFGCSEKDVCEHYERNVHYCEEYWG